MPHPAPQLIPYMPAGAHVIHATINGEPGCARVFVDAAACARLNADLAELWRAARRREHARPVLYFDHKQGEAAAFPRRFVWEDERGILLEIAEWTAAGRAAVEGANYGYISPAFRLSREDGQVLGLVPGVEVGSLVNDPAFERIDPIVDNIAAAKATPPVPGVDIITSAHCNQQHIPNCPKESGGGKWEANPKWSFGEAVQNAFAAENKPKKAYVFKVCEYPEVMQKIAPWKGDVVIRWDNMEKVHSKHGLTPEQIATLPQELEKPIAVMEDPFKKDEFLVITSLEALDRNGKKKKAAAVLKLRKDAEGKIEVADIASAYSRDQSDVYKHAIKEGKLRYLDKNRAMEWARLEEDNLPQLLTTTRATPGSGDIKAQQAEDVNSNEAFFSYILSILAERDADMEDTPQKISTAAALASAPQSPDNENAAKTGGTTTTMTEELKKTLGLPEDADVAAVEAAVAKLVSRNSELQQQAETAQAEAKQKEEELQAARAAQKQAWLDDLKQRGVLAPKDEAAVEAASALFDANPAAARTAYGKMQGSAAGAVITASQVPTDPPAAEQAIEDFIQF